MRRIDHQGLNLWWVLAAILGMRLISMWLFPLVDTSEPRYAEIARLMAHSGDWITPWFKPGVPFWGKPPLSFWAAALSIKLFGVNAFAARLPSWLATVGTVWLLAAYANAHYGQRVAKRAALVYCTCALVYILSGAVLTDPYLVLGTTWAMTSLPMAARKPAWYWRYGFFIGLAIGLLAKGPLALVLVVGPLIPWLAWYKPARATLRALPWKTGLLLTAVISIPWYVAAEIKTPGFLHYFLVGEHFLRFVDPGWTGDLYGTAHSHAWGTIWWYWVLACLPWSPVVIWMLGRALLGRAQRATLKSALRRPDLGYLLAWSIFTPLFFTVAGNILWTYVLPAIGALSILLAVKLDSWRGFSGATAPSIKTLAGVVPVLGVVLTVAALALPQQVSTQRGLVHFAQQRMHGTERLLYVGERPFSARFYSRETAKLIQASQLPTALDRGVPTYLAIPKHLFNHVSGKLPRPMNKLYENKHFILVVIPAADSAMAGPRRP